MVLLASEAEIPAHREGGGVWGGGFYNACSLTKNVFVVVSFLVGEIDRGEGGKGSGTRNITTLRSARHEICVLVRIWTIILMCFHEGAMFFFTS